MTEVLSFGLLSFTSLITIIDPLAVAPVFVAMTEGNSSRDRRIAAIRACSVALGVLLLFAVFGGLIFKLFGITIDALRIAGGILFFGMSMKMLTGSSHGDRAAADSEADPSIVPLGIPLICGPGAISTVMVMMGQGRSVAYSAIVILALTLALVTTTLVLFMAPRIVRLLGTTGISVATRVIGLIVGVIGIQFVIDGVRPVVIEILKAGT